MENLGCVTFREAELLADPADTAKPEMHRIAEVIEHELAHMWFGDLVTLRWWNGVWLNEAFATFMALRCQDDYHPDWECFVAFARLREFAFSSTVCPRPGRSSSRSSRPKRPRRCSTCRSPTSRARPSCG